MLPLEVLGAARGRTIAEGLAEEIASHLASLDGVAVVSRTSAKHHLGTDPTVRQIASETRADHVLEGSLQLEASRGIADRVMIVLRLIRVAEDAAIGTGRYDRHLSSPLDLESAVAREAAACVASALLAPAGEADPAAARAE